MNNNLLIVPSETDKTLIMVPVQAVKQDLITKTDCLIYVPLASKETFGTVKIGEGLSITNGVVSIDPLGVDLQSKVDKFQGKEKHKQSLIIDAEGYVTTGYAKGSIDIYHMASLKKEDAGYLRFSDDFEVFSTEDEGALVSLRVPVLEKTSQLFNDGDGKSSFATIDYVKANGGKIDTIKVNGVPQEIVDKTIELTIPSIEGLASETLVNTKAQEVLTTANKHTDDRISDLIGQAPETLDTLKEIADALTEDQTVLDTLNLAIGNKVNKTLKINGKTLEQDINLTAADVGALSSFTETDPTVPDWAKAATKPSYNYSEINNTPTIPTVNNPTITIKQGEETKGTFTLNQSNDSTIELDVGGGGSGSNVTLYEELGQNTDGAMTQKAVTDELNKFKIKVVTQKSSSSMDAYYEIDMNYADLIKEGTELVIAFNKKPTYVVPIYLQDKNGSACQLYQQSSLQGVNSKASYISFTSESWSAGDLIRIKYTEAITTNTGSRTSGFIVIENISNSYYYGTADNTFNALNDEYGNRIYTTYIKKSELSLDNYVTINTTQTISGSKLFTEAVMVPDVTIG